MTEQQPSKKNPILILTGLAIAGVAAVMGVTKDRWMPSETPPAATQQAQPAAEPSAAQTESAPAASTTAEAQPPTVAQPEAEAAAPAAEPPAAEAAAPSAEQPAAQAAAPATSEQPATVTASDVGEPATASGETTEQSDQIAAAPAPAEAATLEVPSFDTVRVEKTGEAVIAGRAKPGSEVTIMFDGAPIGTAVAGADGSFVVVPEKPLPPGSGGISIVAKAAGETAVTKSGQTVAVIIPEAEQKQDALVAVVSPDQPTKVLQSPAAPQEETQAATAPAGTEEPAAPLSAGKARQIVLDAVDYDPLGNIVFSGQGAPGNSARIYVDNASVGDAVIAADGRWSFAGTAQVAPGVHALRIDSLDAGGSVTSRIEVPFFREETKNVAAADQTMEKTDAETPPAATVEPAAAQPEVGRVVIQPGNNLWRISKVIYGEGTKYTLLYEANKDQIRNPDLIYPGQVFRTPDVVPPETIDPDARDSLTAEPAAQ